MSARPCARVRSAALVALACLLPTATSHAQEAVTDHHHRDAVMGASILPPDGDGWKRVLRPEGEIKLLYFTRLAGDNHTAVATVTIDNGSLAVTEPHAFLEVVRTGRLQPDAGRKTKVLSMELSYDSTGARPGAVYHYICEDGSVPRRKGEVYLLEARGWVGYHPDAPRAIYGVEFSERAPQDERRERIAQADTFLARFQFARVDTSVARTADVGLFPNVVATGFGSLWVSAYTAGERVVGRTPRAVVVRLDPTTLAVQATILVEEEATEIVAGDDAIWVNDRGSGRLGRIDPVSGRLEMVKCGGTPLSLAATPGALWIGDSKSGQVRLLDTRTRAFSTASVSDVRAPWDMTAAEGRVWVANADRRQVIAIDPTTHLVTGAPIGVGGGCSGLAYGAGSLWATCREIHAVQRLDLERRVVIATIPIEGDLTEPAFCDGLLWVGDRFSGRLWSIDPATQRPSAEGRLVGLSMFRLCAGDHGLWFSDTFRGVAGFVRTGTP